MYINKINAIHYFSIIYFYSEILKEIHLKKVLGFQIVFTNYSLRKDIFKEEIKTEKGHENFFFPRYFELCLILQKVKIVDFRFS